MEHSNAVDGFILCNTKLPNLYEIRADDIDYKILKGLVISGKNDKILDPINLKQIAKFFLRLGANLQLTKVNMGHEFSKLSRNIINDLIVQDCKY